MPRGPPTHGADGSGTVVAFDEVMQRSSSSKKRAVRAPFLLTFAALAGALAPACGGNVSPKTPGNGGTGGAGTGGSSGTGGAATGGSGGVGGGQGQCPSEAPVDGTTCAIGGHSCPYPFCGDPAGVTYSC